MDIVNRLKTYMEHVGMPSTQFADVAKVPRPTISQILNGRNRKISNELIAKLHEAFPNLNIMWLLFGDGDIEVNANTQTSEPKNAPNLFSQVEQPTQPQPVIEEQPQVSPQHFALRTSNIEEFVEENTRKKAQNGEHPNPMANLQQQIATNQDAQRKIQSIMVFYNDSSFEIFTPSL